MNLSKTALVRLIVLMLLLGFVTCFQEQSDERNYIEDRPETLYIPELGCLADAEAAVKVAEVVLTLIYGEQILNQRPFRAVLTDDSVWVISGSWPRPRDGAVWVGGVAWIEISKKDARVLGIHHGR